MLGVSQTNFLYILESLQRFKSFLKIVYTKQY